MNSPLVLTDERPTVLQPCPFCGSSSATIECDQPLMVYVMCGDCMCVCGNHGDAREAVAAWNRRALLVLAGPAGGVQEPRLLKTLPELPHHVLEHPQLGKLYDRMAMHLYAMRVEDYLNAPLSPITEQGQTADLVNVTGASSQAQTVDALPGAHIPATLAHDAGAYARCSYCQRYSIDPRTLTAWPPVCDCGNQSGWSGSFFAPTAESQWSLTAGEAQTADRSEGAA
jgi:hypothetical protein